jgi:MATE family multidrug resistance protein
MMLCQFLVGFTDVVVAGHIHSDVQAALGIVTQCHFFILVVGIAVTNGGIAAMSQSLGAGLRLRADRYVGLIFILGGTLCLLTVILGGLFRHTLFFLLQVPAPILPLTEQLWLLFLMVIPANYLTLTTISVFRARKDVWMPMASGILVCAANAVGDFGLGLGWWGMPMLGARGIVIATFTSVLLGGLFNLAVLRRRGFIDRRGFAPWRWQKRALPYIIKVAAPAGAMQILWQMGYMVLFTITATLPIGRITALAGLTAGLRVEAFLFLPALAFNLTGSVLVGHCLGAGNKAEAKRVGMRVIGAGALSMSVVALCLAPFIKEIAAFVSPNDLSVQAVAADYLRINLFSTPFTVTSMILGGIMTGAGATIYTLVIYSSATWLVRLPLAWFLGHMLWQSASGVFLAMLISQVVQSGRGFYVFSEKRLVQVRHDGQTPGFAFFTTTTVSMP